jgi:hypothetical protein
MTAMYNPATGTNSSFVGGGGFNPSSAGAKRYGSGRRNPNQGAAQDMTGYGARDLRNNARKNALMRWVGRN